MSGMPSYLAGQAAEDTVGRAYEQRGSDILERRWRGRHGEIDLIARDRTAIVFVEVKKSQDFLRAAQRVTKTQLSRIFATASEYLEGLPMGQLTECRLDVALVDGQGRYEIMENVLAY